MNNDKESPDRLSDEQANNLIKAIEDIEREEAEAPDSATEASAESHP